MGLLKTLLSVKAADKLADYLDSKNRTGEYIPARKPAKTAKMAGLATLGMQIARRNPKLAITFGAAGAAVFLASYLVKRKQHKPTYY